MNLRQNKKDSEQLRLVEKKLASLCVKPLEKDFDQSSLDSDSDDAKYNCASGTLNNIGSPPPPAILPKTPSRRRYRNVQTDPLRALPALVSCKILSFLSIRDLCNCALVSSSWANNRMLNHVWFELRRMDSFHESILLPRKWSKSQSRQNWRIIHIKSIRDRYQSEISYSRSSANISVSPSSPHYKTPREIKEEQWREEAETLSPCKIEMRKMYKELGGRKARSKIKFGKSRIARDRGGWEGSDFE